MNTKSSIAFYCRKSKANAAGLASIEVVVTIAGERLTSTLPRRCTPQDFERSLKSRAQNPIKEYIAVVTEKIESLKTRCLIEGVCLTKDVLRTSIQYGFAERYYTVGQLFSVFLESQGKKVNAGLSTLRNYRKYEIVRDLFFEHSGVCADVNALSVRQKHILDFHTFLMSIYEGSTVEGMMVKLKSVFIHALKNKMIQENPFMGFTIKKRVKEVEFLTQEEVDRIRRTPMPTNNLGRIRDLFLFQCYTALSYCDMAVLKPSDFKRNEMGYIYIDGKRLKTRVRFIAILFEDAISIAQKYNYELPILSNQKYNAYLKVIADICMIEKPLHTHIGRHTAACYLLNKGLSIDIVAKIMGHSTTRVTRHYAKLLDKTVFIAVDEVVNPKNKGV